MNPDVSDLLKKALALPPAARAALAGSLLESLDDTVDERAEEEWRKEITRRIAELDSGKVKPIPWPKLAARSQPFSSNDHSYPALPSSHSSRQLTPISV
jgi:putative addiction module component (TIGR02574 family)